MRTGYEGYDPDGAGVENGNFLGLPWVSDPAVRFIAVPYDATVSYGAGTAGGPANVLAASLQLDVSVPGVARPWELGFGWEALTCPALERGVGLRRRGAAVIEAVERGAAGDPVDVRTLDGAGAEIAACLERLVSGLSAFPVVVGGEHAVALGAYRACGRGGPYGILQVDAHMDLRDRYEGLLYSHASVMHNALVDERLTRLVQVGVRDYSPGECARAADEGERVRAFTDDALHERLLHGEDFASLAAEIVAELPQRVWVSLDVDGLDPALCAHTGTPVPGGLSFAQADFLLAQVARSGRELIGMDVVEVAAEPHAYEGAVAARLAYRYASRAVSANRAAG